MTGVSAIPVDSLPPKTRTRLSALCEQYRAASEEASSLDKIKRGLMSDIREAMSAAKLDGETVQGEGWRLSKVERETSKISPEKLLEKGVKMGVIEYATEVSVSEYYTVRGVKE